MAEQRAAILLRHAGRPQPAGKRVAQVMHAQASQPDLAAHLLPAVVVHRPDTVPPVGKHLDRAQVVLESPVQL
ncbi:hypothetical protein [Piscinibacter sp. XHJ-5]|uniref:hypothetical protein n=1 Tax=Piscinibacter sp. XHJ-5 TaxID=3037797 RepID=UPI00245306F3|nr:hypothetical protein [Piscinibacter sp. XHJ-5]